MKKPVKSTDPRKPAVVAALKTLSGGTKVTNVRQVGPDTFSGTCFHRVSQGWNGRPVESPR